MSSRSIVQSIMSTCGMATSVSGEQLNIMSEHAITVAEEMKTSRISDENQHEINTAPPLSIFVLPDDFVVTEIPTIDPSSNDVQTIHHISGAEQPSVTDSITSGACTNDIINNTVNVSSGNTSVLNTGIVPVISSEMIKPEIGMSSTITASEIQTSVVCPTTSTPTNIDAGITCNNTTPAIHGISNLTHAVSNLPVVNDLQSKLLPSIPVCHESIGTAEDSDTPKGPTPKVSGTPVRLFSSLSITNQNIATTAVSGAPISPAVLVSTPVEVSTAQGPPAVVLSTTPAVSVATPAEVSAALQASVAVLSATPAVPVAIPTEVLAPPEPAAAVLSATPVVPVAIPTEVLALPEPAAAVLSATPAVSVATLAEVSPIPAISTATLAEVSPTPAVSIATLAEISAAIGASVAVLPTTAVPVTNPIEVLAVQEPSVAVSLPPLVPAATPTEVLAAPEPHMTMSPATLVPAATPTEVLAAPEPHMTMSPATLVPVATPTDVLAAPEIPVRVLSAPPTGVTAISAVTVVKAVVTNSPLVSTGELKVSTTNAATTGNLPAIVDMAMPAAVLPDPALNVPLGTGVDEKKKDTMPTMLIGLDGVNCADMVYRNLHRRAPTSLLTNLSLFMSELQPSTEVQKCIDYLEFHKPPSLADVMVTQYVLNKGMLMRDSEDDVVDISN
jgi:hypothetical protein